jgi:hypothetical protein
MSLVCLTGTKKIQTYPFRIIDSFGSTKRQLNMDIFFALIAILGMSLGMVMIMTGIGFLKSGLKQTKPVPEMVNKKKFNKRM